MSYSRSHQYYEQPSRSRSRDRKYRREYREEGDRYGSSYGNYTEYSGGSSARYERRAPRQTSYTSSHKAPEPTTMPPSLVLAVFNLSIYTTEAELYDVFSKFGPLKKATVVLDAKTGRSRGFGFVYFDSIEDAKVAHAQADGIEIGDRRIRIDFSATEKPHDPTPGVYFGKVSYPKSGGRQSFGPPAPVANTNVSATMASTGGYYHCRACEIEARERERWEREARRYGNGDQYYYQEKYATADTRTRDRSAMSRTRNDYYRGGAGYR
ncbi:transformer-2 protein homolog alpha-like [Wyeomyia smithii]|uniref:transformer-2 protein homolog alpha-like n=1 Tax=Wyeomyia smithii TaxID=174621 RepID=UPI0024681DEA|nr:transformer-2 protein homolog alpha-like [Wyeomyia smithii]